MARGRKAMDLEEKIDNAIKAEASVAQTDFIAWLVENTELEIDERTVILVQKLYPEYLKTPEAASAIAERKEESEAKKLERLAKAQDAFMARAQKLGFKVEKVVEEDAE